jgi:cytochrome b6-f complex iron-sulfur subunit
MRLLDDLATPETQTDTSRRRLLGIATVSALGSSLMGSMVISVRYLWPSVLFELPTRFLAARLSDLERRTVLFLRKRRIYVVKDREGVFAESAVCTHLGCLTRPNPNEDGFFCPCHGSRFSLDGKVLDGPAPRPLEHFRMDRQGDRLWVDVAREEDPDVRVRV